MIDLLQMTLLSINEICKKLGVSRSTFDRWRREDRENELGLTLFPEPTLHVGGSARWDVSAINAWLEENKDKKIHRPGYR